MFPQSSTASRYDSFSFPRVKDIFKCSGSQHRHSAATTWRLAPSMGPNGKPLTRHTLRTSWMRTSTLSPRLARLIVTCGRVSKFVTSRSPSTPSVFVREKQQKNKILPQEKCDFSSFSSAAVQLDLPTHLTLSLCRRPSRTWHTPPTRRRPHYNGCLRLTSRGITRCLSWHRRSRLALLPHMQCGYSSHPADVRTGCGIASEVCMRPRLASHSFNMSQFLVGWRCVVCKGECFTCGVVCDPCAVKAPSGASTQLVVGGGRRKQVPQTDAVRWYRNTILG